MEVPDTRYVGGRGSAIDVTAVCRAWVAGWHQPLVRTTPLSDHPYLLMEDGAEEVKTTRACTPAAFAALPDAAVVDLRC
eukprot:2327213-Alexandrium_andersonii.AAC.1